MKVTAHRAEEIRPPLTGITIELSVADATIFRNRYRDFTKAGLYSQLLCEIDRRLEEEGVLRFA